MQVTSDGATKKGHLMILTDASQDTWERRWFVLKRCGTFNEQGSFADSSADHIYISLLIQMSWRRPVS